MASTSLYRTESAGSRTTFTWSAWVKRSKSGSSQFLASCSYSASDEAYFFFNGGDKLIWQSSSASYGDVQTNRLFRDTNAWYHIVLAVDTTQATASNRIRFYVNGVEETSFSTANYPNQNTQVYWNVGGTYYPRIGKRHANADNFDGSMSHVVHIDGTQELPTIFGETDSTTGEWKIKTSITPSVGWGTNGYHILKDGNSLTDQSGQGNNWTAIGTLTKTEDNPSNVFATFNSLMHFRQPTPLLYGNTVIENGDAQWENGYGTIATPTTGKFYAEFKYPVFGGGAYGHAGIIAVDDIATQASGYLNFGDTANSWSISVTDGSVYNNASSIATYSSISANGIIGLAIDCTNSKLYISVNGTWQNSADPSAGTGGISITSDKEYYVGGKVYNAYINANFGNGYFGTTAVSSAGTNASGNGIFEYDVPTGYTALSTKGLNL